MLYGFTTLTLTKCIEKKLDERYWKKSWIQHPTSQQLYGYLYLPPRKPSKLDELDIQDTAGEVTTNSYARFSCGSLQTEEQVLGDYLQLLCSETGCSMEDLPRAMDDRDEMKKKAGNTC